MKKYFIILFVLLSILPLACRDTDMPTAVSPVEDIWMHDLANDENASDLQVLFVLSEVYASKGLRVIIAKESPQTPISSEHLETLESGSYTIVNTSNDLSYKIRLNQNQLDSDGEPLAHDVSYMAYVYSAESGAFSYTAEALAFSDNHIYQGKYKGDWSDNLFSGIAISCSIEGKGNALFRGPVYISGNFTPAFGATNDNGEIKMEIADDVISSFEFNQHAPDYMGGCPGLYTGSGIVDDNFNLIINFTGDDCDGHHTDGIMNFYRVWKE
ncbi:MAG: hypothetical protein AAF587_44095 [Bacteroidota bacterium]